MTDQERAERVESPGRRLRIETAGGLARSEVRSIWSEVKQTAKELAEVEERYGELVEAEDFGRLRMEP